MNKIAIYSIIFITFLISAIAYHTYFENGWYVQDDYITIEKGGAGSIAQTSGQIISWLHSGQGRFQPVRLFVFSAATHMFQEEYAPIYNFVLHLANLLLLFFLLRKFNASHVSSLIILLVFSLFGSYRMMESPSAMIAGDGLNLLFILITLLFLIKAIKENYWGIKKIFWFAISLTSYAGLTFSYEVAFPLFIVIFYTAIIFNNERSNQWDIRRYFPLGAYIALLFIYLIFFRQTESAYEGASIVWSYDILTRFKSYLSYAISYPIKFKARPEVILFFVLYFVAIYQAVKADKAAIKADKAATIKEQLDSPISLSKYKLFAFGVIFYFSSVVLLTLNHWQSPTSIMLHHIYLITVGSSIFIVSLILGLRHFFIEPVKKIYFYSMILILFPIILVGGFCSNIEIYEGQKQRTDSIKLLKYKIQSSIEDPAKIDAILIKNFPQNSYGISGMDGAYLQWFDYKKYIHSGREIISVLDNNIKFKGPLTYYNAPKEVRDVDNGKVEIFYLSDVDKNLLTYSNDINFQAGKNLHQLDQVMSDGQQCDKDYILNAVFKNIYGKDTLAISLNSVKDIKSFLKGASIEINGRAVKSVLTADKNIFINGVAGTKYIFLKITSIDDRFKSHLNAIEITSMPSDIKSTRVRFDDAPPAFLQGASLPSPTLEWSNGFYGLESDATHNWRWASQTGDLVITNPAQQPLKITFEMNIGSAQNGSYVLAINGELWHEQLSISNKSKPYRKTLLVPPGRHLVRFESNAPVFVSPDPRVLSYVLENFRVVGCTSRLKLGEHVNAGK